MYSVVPSVPPSTSSTLEPTSPYDKFTPSYCPSPFIFVFRSPPLRTSPYFPLVYSEQALWFPSSMFSSILHNFQPLTHMLCLIRLYAPLPLHDRDLPPITSRSSSIAPPAHPGTPTPLQDQSGSPLISSLDDIFPDTLRSNGQPVVIPQADTHHDMYACGSSNNANRDSLAK
ncbi:hypothetical protein BC629DRAFT_1596847 [Irpex lacteus]|nr:hypothetical protein BC629DRAFT_1596847 [Irpex lacteus]